MLRSNRPLRLSLSPRAARPASPASASMPAAAPLARRAAPVRRALARLGLGGLDLGGEAAATATATGNAAAAGAWRASGPVDVTWSVDAPLNGGARPRRVAGVLKRALDIVGAGTGIVVLSPLFVSFALAVRFGPGGGRVLFGHTRIGRHGRPFRCWKFRTMVENGDEVLRRHLAASASARREWETTRKLRHDPRVTPLGLVMRKLSIDELPQLFNVLCGEMSLVGPRPVVADELERYGRSATYYLQSRPGLTGLWQISGRNDVDYRRRVAFDRWYVGHWSLATDVAIIARTVPVVCLARGSY